MNLASFVLFIIYAFLFRQSRGEFGVARQASIEAEGPDNLEDEPTSANLVEKLMEGWHELDQATAVEIVAVIEAAKQDPETVVLVRRLNNGGGKDSLQSLKNDLPKQQIVRLLARSLEEMKAAEILFRDPRRAYEEMEKEGLIPADMKSVYKRDPTLLADDKKKSLYFSFVTMASTGGFM
jgi:hypothetical protein